MFVLVKDIDGQGNVICCYDSFADAVIAAEKLDCEYRIYEGEEDINGLKEVRRGEISPDQY